MSNADESTPEVAPAHTDARSEFSASAIALVLGLGAVAIIAGTVLGLVFTT